MAKTANINVRIEPEVKQNAEDLFGSFGISVTAVSYTHLTLPTTPYV